MKTLVLSLIVAVSFSSCASGPSARRGTMIGGLGGAAVGALAGSGSGNALEGALIGGGIGAVAGNVIGDSKDRRRGTSRTWY